jgi:hypothetical protein
MAEESFENRVLRSAGLPTSADHKAAEEARDKEARELQADIPRRQALLETFNRGIGSVIDSTFIQVKAALDGSPESRFTLSDMRYGANPREALSQKAFFIAQKAQGAVNRRVPESPWLMFILDLQGNLTIRLEHRNASRNQGATFKTRAAPLSEILPEVIREAFTDYLAALK